MEIKKHTENGLNIAELISDQLLINTVEDAKDILGDVYYNGFESMIVHHNNITPTFFDLKTGMAGEILQKFTNYRMKLAIVGDFSTYNSKSLGNFIRESNRYGNIIFAEQIEHALKMLTNQG